MVTKKQGLQLWNLSIIKAAMRDACLKLSPKHQIKNPVMFAVYLGSLLTSILFVQALLGDGEASAWFIFSITAWLWFTLLFANFAESMAEGRGKAQAQSLRKARREIQAKKLSKPCSYSNMTPAKITLIQSELLRTNDLVLVESGDVIPSDGEIIEGIATVDESAITGESAPVIREFGGDRSAVTGGTQVLSDWLIVRITTDPG